MKIAVASTNGTDVSPHFGRSRCFVVFTVTNGQITAEEVRDNTYTAHAQGRCDDQSGQHHAEPHSHSDIVDALRDCAVVLCGSMGWRAAQALEAAHVRPVVTQQTGTARELVTEYLAGKIARQAPFCRCHE